MARKKRLRADEARGIMSWPLAPDNQPLVLKNHDVRGLSCSQFLGCLPSFIICGAGFKGLKLCANLLCLCCYCSWCISILPTIAPTILLCSSQRRQASSVSFITPNFTLFCYMIPDHWPWWRYSRFPCSWQQKVNCRSFWSPLLPLFSRAIDLKHHAPNYEAWRRPSDVPSCLLRPGWGVLASPMPWKSWFSPSRSLDGPRKGFVPCACNSWTGQSVCQIYSMLADYTEWW